MRRKSTFHGKKGVLSEAIMNSNKKKKVGFTMKNDSFATLPIVDDQKAEDPQQTTI